MYIYIADSGFGFFPKVELAEGASERQTKVAACELLHAVVLFMVGTNAHSPRRDNSDGPVRCCFFPLSLSRLVDLNIYINGH